MAFHPFHRRRGDSDDVPVDRHELAALVGETEAFVAGGLADHYASTGRNIPIWTLLNRLAHGTTDEIADLLTINATRGWRAHPSAAGWIVREQALALRLLEVASSPRALRRIQSAALVPAELELIQRGKAGPLDPDDVADTAKTALDRHLLDR